MKTLIKCFKFHWINSGGKVQADYFTTEEAGFDWIDRYGVEYFGHKADQAPEEMIMF